MNLSIIRSFIKDQVYVDNILRDKLKIPFNVTGPLWSSKISEIQQAYDKAPFAKKFYLHGFGVEYEDENVFIDYDYGDVVSLGGFDEWRIYMYLTKGDPIKWDNTRSLQKSISIWFEEMKSNKTINMQRSLYYLVC